MRARKSQPSTFNIIDAAAYGYRTALRHWQYLAVAGLLPFVVNTVSTMAILQAEDTSILMQFMWNLPATVVSGWYMFLVMRLATFGEKVDNLPSHPAAIMERALLMRISVILWAIINMVLALIVSYLLWAATQLDPQRTGGVDDTARYLVIPNMILIGACFWCVRLTIVHLLAAVDYPIKTYIYQVNGAWFSLRLIALSIFCFLPPALIQQMILQPIIGQNASISTLSFPVQAAFAVVTGFFPVIVSAVMTSAVADALRQQLGGRAVKKKTI